MAQFSKGTFIYLKLSRSESKNPIYLMCEGVQRAGFCNIINSLRFQLWGLSIGSLADCRELRVIRSQASQHITLPGFATKESICCCLSVLDKTETRTFVFLAFRDIIY